MDKEPFISSESHISLGGLLVRKHYCLGMRRQGKRQYGSYVIPRYDGGTDSSGKKFKSNIWDSIYKLLSDNQIDVEGYVEFVFSRNKSVSNPQVLKAPDFINRYKKELYREEKPTVWEFEDNKIMTELSVQGHILTKQIDVYTRVLLDDTINVSPLTRYSFGVKSGMYFVVKPLEEEAFQQYFRRRYFYERHYSDKIPEQFRKKAVELNDNN